VLRRQAVVWHVSCSGWLARLSSGRRLRFGGWPMLAIGLLGWLVGLETETRPSHVLVCAPLWLKHDYPIAASMHHRRDNFEMIELQIKTQCQR